MNEREENDEPVQGPCSLNGLRLSVSLHSAWITYPFIGDVDLEVRGRWGSVGRHVDEI
jgi:hypothetical protein